jgi:hypothetical protein
MRRPARFEGDIWPAAYGPPPTLRKVLAGLDENIAAAMVASESAWRRYHAAEIGSQALIEAREAVARARLELAGWRVERAWWVRLAETYPDLVDQPGQLAARAWYDGEPSRRRVEPPRVLVREAEELADGDALPF